MKVKVAIEEVITQTFEVEVSSYDNAYEEIRAKYKAREIVVENPTLIEANCMIFEENGEETDWNNMHI